MNLVAKEFVSARDDERGVLILSEFAGAARELTDALLVNPRNLEHAAHTLAAALSMPDEEQSRRMRAMRAVVSEFNTYRWAGEMLADGARLRRDPVYLPEGDRPSWPPETVRAVPSGLRIS
jgi:trehalose 6-phosphate synthase